MCGTNKYKLYIYYIYIVVRKCPSFQPLVDDLKLLKMLICHKCVTLPEGVYGLCCQNHQDHMEVACKYPS